MCGLFMNRYQHITDYKQHQLIHIYLYITVTQMYAYVVVCTAAMAFGTLCIGMNAAMAFGTYTCSGYNGLYHVCLCIYLYSKP